MGETANRRLHLDAVIGDAETDGKPKALDSQIGRCAGIGVNEHRITTQGGTDRFDRIWTHYHLALRGQINVVDRH